MKILRVKVLKADTCGGLLDGFELRLRNSKCEYDEFAPICLIGPNGAGKSQFLQVLAEIMQAILCVCYPKEERKDSNPELLFEIEYLIRPKGQKTPVHMRVKRTEGPRRTPKLTIERKEDSDWINCDVDEAKELVPQKVVGYTSGDNETLSFPFLISRAEYADEVGKNALNSEKRGKPISDTRLMLIDYGTHLEVLVANLLFGNDAQRKPLLNDLRLRGLHSCRCIIQLAHRAAPKAPKKVFQETGRKGVQLTDELEEYLRHLQACATCHHYDEKTETYTFDFWIDEETVEAFKSFWENALDLYSSLHKLSMLNDLVNSRPTRKRFQKATRERHFASRLPDPPEEDKVFRFERVRFIPKDGGEEVDYVSLSDGEHQLAQLLGVLCMISFPDALFLLDEPESHFNPQWRAKAITRIYDQPTSGGVRRPKVGKGDAVQQDCFLTTHSPFVPSDMHSSQVFVFKKEDGGEVKALPPEVETYGATFDTIITECFGVRPPISDVAMKEIKKLKTSDDREELTEAMNTLGNSVEKLFLAEKLRNLPPTSSEE